MKFLIFIVVVFVGFCIYYYITHSKFPFKKASSDKDSPVRNYIKFGSYYQQDGENKTPIEWTELERTDDTVLMISRFGLDCVRFNNSNESLTWETSVLRRWLNTEFLQTAFTEEEQTRIVLTERGPTPFQQDKVTLLSDEEKFKYSVNNSFDVIVSPTKYAKSKGANIWVHDGREVGGWWLRTTEFAGIVYEKGFYWPSFVSSDGRVLGEGIRADEEGYLARPVIRIKIDS